MLYFLFDTVLGNGFNFDADVDTDTFYLFQILLSFFPLACLLTSSF